jgi:C4-dicarboxylate transporter, DctM subunit
VVAILAVYGMYVGIRNKVPRAKFNRKEAFHTAWVFKWELLIPIVLVTGLGTGMFRVHEASAFTAIYVLIVELFVYRDVSITKDLPRITIKSMIMVGAILTIVATAVGFCGWNVQAQIPDRLADYMESLISSKFVFLFLLNIFLLIVGMLMDIFTAMMVVIPMLMPLAKLYHVDPYHLAIVFILNLEIGYLTPPFGLNLFISTIRFSRPFMYVVRTVLPYIAILIVALGVVTYVPWFSTVGANLITADESVSPMSSVVDTMGDTDAGAMPSVMDQAEYDKMLQGKPKPPASDSVKNNSF